jgi:uncharacterized protein RhaS with RHS repeats
MGFEGGTNLYRYCPNPIGWTDELGLVPAKVTQAPSAFTNFNGGKTSYNSASTNGPPILSTLLNEAPAGSPARNQTCGEQKFAMDLMAFGKTKAGRDLPPRKRKYKLEGKYPPCPTCHGALMRAAADSGSKVEYSWEQPKGKINKVTYKGTKDGNCKVSGKGGVGKELVKGYDHSLGPSADPKSPTKQGFFGVGFSQQSDDTYAALR